MWLLILSIVIQALLIVHCIKTGRNQLWIWVLALLSYAGVIAYVAAELVPELLRSGTTRSAVRNARRTLDPGAELRQLAQRAEIGGSVDTRQRHAEELLLGLARAQFAACHPGAEAAVRCAQLLRSQGENEAAWQVLRSLMPQATVAPRHYRRAQEQWLRLAERELAALWIPDSTPQGIA